MTEGVRVLGNSILVNEIGLDRADSTQFDTFELLVHWHQLMVALARLEAIAR